LLTALTTVVAMRMVGVLLVSAMIVIPTLTGFALGRSFRRATALAIVTALASVAIGLTAGVLPEPGRGRRGGAEPLCCSSRWLHWPGAYRGVRGRVSPP